MKNNQLSWWQGNLIYQIYPRSFFDNNGDGIGDIRGIIKKLDYLEWLGIQGIWISPFFKSPMQDFGYDISDYKEIDVLFGNMDDFDQLIYQAKRRNIHVMIDFVLNHTSNQHTWFMESRTNKTNPKSDWYVWADPKEDGSAPNNWLSIFGGSAWEWEPRREQYYLHNFLKSQPDLNYYSPDVQDEMLNILRFWLEKGVSGIRLDAVNFCFHHQNLNDNPPIDRSKRNLGGFSSSNPYAYQAHIYDKSQKEALIFMEKIRAILDEYPHTFSIGEIGDDNPVQTSKEYMQENRLHSVYNFDLLSANPNSSELRSLLKNYESENPTWSLSNHDVERVYTRWSKYLNTECNTALRKLVLDFLFSLNGTLILYQGDELGLTEVEIPFEEIQDPYGKTFYPEFKGRDGCRTPMPWNQFGIHNGFTTGKPWLNIGETHKDLAVNKQRSDHLSILNYCRKLIRERQSNFCLRNGKMKVSEKRGLLVIERTLDNQKIEFVFNFSKEEIQYKEKGITLLPLSSEKVEVNNDLKSKAA